MSVFKADQYRALTKSIERVKAVALQAVSYEITNLDMFNVLFPPDVRDKIVAVTGFMRSPDISMTWDTSDGHRCTINTYAHVRCSSGFPSPPCPAKAYVPQDMAAAESRAKIDEAFLKVQEVTQAWVFVERTFDRLNMECKNLKHLRSVFPAIHPFMESHRDDAVLLTLANGVRNWTPSQPLPEWQGWFMKQVKEANLTLEMGMLLPLDFSRPRPVEIIAG